MSNPSQQPQRPEPLPKVPAPPQPQTEKKGGEPGGTERRG